MSIGIKRKGKYFFQILKASLVSAIDHEIPIRNNRKKINENLLTGLAHASIKCCLRPPDNKININVKKRNTFVRAGPKMIKKETKVAQKKAIFWFKDLKLRVPIH